MSSEDIVPEYFTGQKNGLTGSENLWIVEVKEGYWKE